MRDIGIENFSRGQQRDGALVQNKLYALRSLINYDIDYTDGRLVVRPGYERWNGTALPDIADQIFIWIDLSENEHMLALCAGTHDRWYLANEVGAHLLLMDEYVSAPVPLIPAGDRLFIATDSGWYWLDHASLSSVPPYYRAGILKPGDGLTISATAASGHLDTPDPALFLEMRPTTRHRYGVQYDVGASDERISAIYISVQMWNVGIDKPGTWRVKCYTDSGGEPSSALVDGNAISQEVAITHFNVGSYQYKRFTFNGAFDLPASSTVWFVIEGDDNYYDSYYNLFADPQNFYASIGFQGGAGPYTYGATLTYDTGTGLWTPFNGECVFYLGGIEPDYVYGYVMTYYNDTYAIESRPSEEIRLEIAEEQRFLVSNYPATSDPQVDTIRIYRRQMDEVEDAEEDITDEYKLVGEFAYGAILYDSFETASLGPVLQTQDHYAIDETDEDEGGYRPTEVVPHTAALWKGRIWLAAQDENILRYSKLLEKNGGTGIIGDSIYDYFPFENRLRIGTPSAIIGIHALSEDQLVIYTRDEKVWLIWGADEPRNPPSDIYIREALATHGLIPKRGIDQMKNSHVYISAQGLRAFAGSQEPIPGVTSKTNQSLLDAISGLNLRESVVRVFGDEIWCLLDLDDDGDLESVMILDLSADVSPELVYKPWKTYMYDVTLTDLCVRPTASEIKTMFAADAENKYILKLNTGTQDNGNDIDCEGETHDMRARNMSSITQFEMDANYPGTPPSITVTLTSHGGDTAQFTLTPSSSNDIRGHRKGLRLKAPVSVRLKWEHSSSESDEILSIIARYIGE